MKTAPADGQGGLCLSASYLAAFDAAAQVGVQLALGYNG